MQGLSGSPVFDETAARRGASDNVTFFMERVRLGASSDINGVPQYKEVEMIRVDIPPKDFIARKVTDADRARYADKYAAFKAGREQPLEGTPLDECPVVPRTAAESWKQVQIKTVEQLIECTDSRVAGVPEGREFQKAAKRWYKAAKEAADKSILLKEIDELRAQLEARDQQMKELDRKFDELTKGKK